MADKIVSSFPAIFLFLFCFLSFQISISISPLLTVYSILLFAIILLSLNLVYIWNCILSALSAHRLYTLFSEVVHLLYFYYDIVTMTNRVPFIFMVVLSTKYIRCKRFIFGIIVVHQGTNFVSGVSS